MTTGIKGLTYAMAAFNLMFHRDVDLAYNLLKQDLHAVTNTNDQVPVKLANGQVVHVNVGEVSVKTKSKLLA